MAASRIGECLLPSQCQKFDSRLCAVTLVGVGGSATPARTCAPAQGRIHFLGSGEVEFPLEGSGEAKPAPKGSGEAEPAPKGSDEAMVTPFNHSGDLIVDDHQFPFFGYPTIGT
jgi:hypothetical protein